MSKWLAIAVVPALVAASAASAQSSGRFIAGHATSRALDLRLLEESGTVRPAPLIRGMIVRQQIAPNAAFGLGLANIYTKRKGSAEWRVGEPAPHSRRPAITFMLKF
jgi:hypothetical protein